MTTTDITTTSNGRGDTPPGDTPPGYDLPAMPARATASQATSVEQTRAAAEVLAAVQAAKLHPRSTNEALRRMHDVCQQKAMADQAFYSYRRAGSPVTGPTVHLARALAACWGNIKYGITELSREPQQSEMKAWAWDLETNTVVESTFFVAHVRDTTKDGKKPLTDERDIYENNANMGARRLREQILAVIPSWFTTEAKDASMTTLRSDGKEKPIAVRCDDMAKWFRGKHQVTRVQLEKRFGPMSRWDDVTLANLRVLGGTLGRGETTIDQEFDRDELDPSAIDAAPNPANGGKQTDPNHDAPPEPPADDPWGGTTQQQQ